MTGPMRVDAAALRGCGPAFADLAALVDSIVRRLSDRLDAEGSCWGADTTGVTFQASYQPAATAVREAMPGLRDGVASVGTALVTVAGNVEGAETRSSYRFGGDGS